MSVQGSKKLQRQQEEQNLSSSVGEVEGSSGRHWWSFDPSKFTIFDWPQYHHAEQQQQEEEQSQEEKRSDKCDDEIETAVAADEAYLNKMSLFNELAWGW